MIAATVRAWHAADGWGVLDSGETPGGCWVHVSHIDQDGQPDLEVGDHVDLEFEAAEQDGYAYRAVRVLIPGRAPASHREAAPSTAYWSELTVDMDDE